MSRLNQVLVQQIRISRESFSISLNIMESYVRKEEVRVIPDSDLIEVRYDYDPPCGMIENLIKIQFF